MKTKTITWHGCYDESWNGLIVDDAFAHPAKFSPGLIKRILQHGLDQGYWQCGETIGDPFGGIAGGGVMAGQMGLNWRGVELEPRFVELGNRNIALNRKFFDGCTVELLQGDSRKFAEIVMARAIVTSPPYGGNANSDKTQDSRDERRGFKQGAGGFRASEAYGDTEGQIGSLSPGAVESVITSPPYNKPFSQEHPGSAGGERGTTPSTTGEFVQYGVAVGQIEGMPNGSVESVITSPPFTTDQPCASQARLNGNIQGPAKRDTNMQSAGNIAALKSGDVDGVVSSPPFLDARSGTTPSRKGATAPTKHDPEAWGTSPGQIGELRDGTLDATVTSPPWEKNVEGGIKGHKFKFIPTQGSGHGCTEAARKRQLERDEQKVYGESDGQIGKENKETYWQAMREVYAQCFLAIKPGGYMAVVVKDYVKDKARVPLCDDTLRLLVAVGFEPVERIHAMLTKTTTRDGLFGSESKTTERKSFFRRLAEKKGSPRIDWEEVLIVRKP